MNADEFAQVNPRIDIEAARKIVENHGLHWDDFLDDLGTQAMYDTKNLLDWLGY